MTKQKLIDERKRRRLEEESAFRYGGIASHTPLCLADA